MNLIYRQIISVYILIVDYSFFPDIFHKFDLRLIPKPIQYETKNPRYFTFNSSIISNLH